MTAATSSSVRVVAIRHAICLWLLTLLFAGRVAAQALQYWLPQAFLPDFSRFQGSSLPYAVLLPIQFLILAILLRACLALGSGRRIPVRRKGKLLAWLGGIYVAGSLGRIVVGLTMSSAPPWFSTWIPALFHLILAGCVLVLAHFHLGPRS